MLDLSSNDIRGTVPACLAAAPRLLELSLANNTLSGALPLRASPGGPVLQVLDVSTNKLTAGLEGLAEQKVRG